MISRILRITAGVGGVLGAVAVGMAQPEVVLSMDGPSAFAQPFRVSGDQEWELRGEVVYRPEQQTLTVAGVYQTGQSIEPDSFLSYQITAPAGEVLVADGQRFPWERQPDGSLNSRFEFTIPEIARDPERPDWAIAFNAVKEGEYWYRDAYPEIEFPRIVLMELPDRDFYVPMVTGTPRYLPAGFATRIPAWFRVGTRDWEHSGFVPSLDLLAADTPTKVTSSRLEVERVSAHGFIGWMPLGPHEERVLRVRPGMVWENVRWYDGLDWFPFDSVTFVSPVRYLLAAAALGGLLLTGWWWLISLTAAWPRRILMLPLVAVAVWWAGHLAMSGFWPMILVVVVSWGLSRSEFLTPRTLTYACAWVFMVWMEIYWGQLEGTANIRSSAVLFSAATWAILLSPLLAIRSTRWRIAVALGATAIWWFATVLGVAYFEFFQDFPSVGDLWYAGQIGQLGDSVGTLLGPRHWLPLWVWGMMLCAAIIGSRINGKPRSKIQNT